MTEDEAILQAYEKQLRIAMERVTEMEKAIAKHKQRMNKRIANQECPNGHGEMLFGFCDICKFTPAQKGE